jgi:hypothetical protein
MKNIYTIRNSNSVSPAEKSASQGGSGFFSFLKTATKTQRRRRRIYKGMNSTLKIIMTMG